MAQMTWPPEDFATWPPEATPPQEDEVLNDKLLAQLNDASERLLCSPSECTSETCATPPSSARSCGRSVENDSEDTTRRNELSPSAPSRTASAWRNRATPEWQKTMPSLEVLLEKHPTAAQAPTNCPLSARTTATLPSSLHGFDIDDLACDALALDEIGVAVSAGLSAVGEDGSALQTPSSNETSLASKEGQTSKESSSAEETTSSPHCLERLVQEDISPMTSRTAQHCHKTRILKPPVSTPGPGPASFQLLRGSDEPDPRFPSFLCPEVSSIGCPEVSLADTHQPMRCSVPTTSSPSWSPAKGMMRGHRELFCDLSSEEEVRPTVQLQVYHFHGLSKSLGLPLFHVGVEVAGSEVFFGASGVCRCKPGALECYAHVKSVQLGQTLLTLRQVRTLVSQLAVEWPGEDYNLLVFNCQTFAVEFVTRLGLKEKLPLEYVSCSNMLDFGRLSLSSILAPPRDPPDPITADAVGGRIVVSLDDPAEKVEKNQRLVAVCTI